MPAYSTVRRAVLGTGDPTERKVRFMALLTAELPKGKRPVLTGGSAIEVYMDGTLRTGDMDIVYPARELEAVLRSWRFALGGGLRSWVNDELGLAVDMVGGELSGSAEKLATFTTEYGPATILGVEDLVLKRLMSAKFGGVPTDVEQAYLLARAYSDTMDWGYVEAAAQRGLVADSLETLKGMLSKAAAPGKGPVRGGRTSSRSRPSRPSRAKARPGGP
ncbi:MAG: hypothetical protein KGI26_04020 [Thaumarchaeota archaeon]|nr:hypothetical protein [Nitrososphaerota archaeon]